MKKGFIACLSLVITFYSCTENTKEETNTQQENVAITDTSTFDLGKEITLTSGRVAISVAPEQGGKISSLKFNQKEFLSLWDIHEDNWGSTFWASPQKLWGWPPPKAFDVLPYEVVEEASDKVKIKGQKDEVTGMTFYKTLTVKDEIISITYEIENNTDSVINVAPWEITRVPPNGLSFFPKGEHEQAPFTIVDTTGYIWFDYKNSKIQEGHDKLKADASEGWLAHVNENIMLVKFFPNITPVEVDIDEAEIEIYANPDKIYIELEPQGPLYGLEPAEKLSWTVYWVLEEVGESTEVKVGNQELINLAKAQKEKIPSNL